MPMDMHGRDDIFYMIGHHPDDAQQRERLNMIEDPNITDDDGLSYLHVAAINYNVGAAEVLLKKGADPNIIDNRGRTPLSYAIGRKNPNLVKLVQLLLDYGADLDYKSGERTIRETIKMFQNSELIRFVE